MSERCGDCNSDDAACVQCHVEPLEAEVKRLRAALERIESDDMKVYVNGEWAGDTSPRRVARNALWPDRFPTVEPADR